MKTHPNAKISRRGFQGIDGRAKFLPQRLLESELASAADQSLRELGGDPAVAWPIGTGECVAGDSGADTHVIELVTPGAQTVFEISETVAEIDLGNGHGQKLLPTGEVTDVVVSLVPLYAAPDLLGVEPGHRLRFSGSCCRHFGTLARKLF